MGRTIKVSMRESYVTFLFRGEVELDLDDYPELQGKTDEEITEYIYSNSSEMKAPEGFKYVDNLWDACMEMDVISDKIKNEEYDLDVEF